MAVENYPALSDKKPSVVRRCDLEMVSLVNVMLGAVHKLSHLKIGDV